jgi:hypothetical protein
MKSKFAYFIGTSSHCVFSNTIQNFAVLRTKKSQPMGYQDFSAPRAHRNFYSFNTMEERNCSNPEQTLLTRHADAL